GSARRFLSVHAFRALGFRAGQRVRQQVRQFRQQRAIATIDVAAAADGDGKEPGLETGTPGIEATQVPESIDKRLLYHVLGVLPVKEQAVTQPVNRGRVPRV